MTIYPSFTLTDVSTPFTAGEAITVQSNALVEGTGTAVFLLRGTGNYTLDIQGSVFGFGQNSYAIFLIVPGGSHEINIGASGSVFGHRGAIITLISNSLSQDPIDLKITNNGSILTDSTVVAESAIAHYSNGNVEITNNGLISAKSSNAIRFDGNGTHTLTGNGTIAAETANTYAYISMHAEAVENINYDGNILGRMSLGGGADILDIIEGRITGHVELGYGADIYKGSYSLATADNVSAGADNDRVWGNAGNDSINGDSGDDTVYGGAGNDVLLGAENTAAGDWVSYFFDSAGVRVNLAIVTAQNTIGAGIDTISQFENLQGTNGFADVLSGNAGMNQISGMGGNDTLFGGIDALADTLRGGPGNDIYRVNTSDLIDELAGQGTADRVRALQSFALAADDHIEFLETDKAAAVTAINLTGNSLLGQRVTGNAGSNILSGLGGTDILNGLGGADTLVGGAGRDILTGGSNRDRFKFQVGDSVPLATSMDVITDYAKGAQGAAGSGEAIDYALAMKIGGTAAAATGSAAAISATTGLASFAAGSGGNLSDCLNDIAVRIHVGGTQAGEFALFRVANAGPLHLFISDAVAGVSLGDVVVQLSNVSSVNSIGLLNGDLTILA